MEPIFLLVPYNRRKMSQAQGIKLQPIKMGDLVAKANATTSISSSERKSGYVPPHMRSTQSTDSGPISLSANDFPSMGTGPTPVPVSSKLKKTINFKKAAETGIEQERLNEEELRRLAETDIFKMSDRELYQAGWDIVNLGRQFNTYQDTVLDDDLQLTEFPLRSILEELEHDAELYFTASIQNKPIHNSYSFRRKVRSNEPLNEACMRYAKAKAKTNL